MRKIKIFIGSSRSAEAACNEWVELSKAFIVSVTTTDTINDYSFILTVVYEESKGIGL
jgi:hypothetical protein